MTKIEWVKNSDGSLGKTWNPIAGCSIVSPGCTNCYAMTMAARLEAIARADTAKRTDPHHGGKTFDSPIAHYIGLTQPSKAGPVWTGKIAIASNPAVMAPARRKMPTTYFVNSMSDLFHEDVPDAWIDKVFLVMALSPQHTFQVLTKRSARMRAYFAAPAKGKLNSEGTAEQRVKELHHWARFDNDPGWRGWPLPNVWLGVSTERQKEADERIPDLLKTPAAIRFISAEPLLGPLDLQRYIWESEEPGIRPWPRLDWVITGGESGRGARLMHPAWARSIRDQCAQADVAFFFKQWGAWLPSNDEVNFADGEAWARRHFPGRPFEHHSSGHTFVDVGKRLAGHMLDGREWMQMPRQAIEAA